jgi:hypothetical protein
MTPTSKKLRLNKLTLTRLDRAAVALGERARRYKRFTPALLAAGTAVLVGCGTDTCLPFVCNFRG